MIIGVPKEIKSCENRVSLIPSSEKLLSKMITLYMLKRVQV